MNNETKQAHFLAKMKMDYDFKVAYAETRVHEFIKKAGEMGKDVVVSCGGLDSITLLRFIHYIGYNVMGAGVSSIEDTTVRAVHKHYNIIDVKPIKSKYHVIRDIGYPLFSKEISRKINVIQNPTSKNVIYRNAILNGITADGRVTTITKLPNKYIKMFNSGCFDECKISDKCCYYLKEKPMNDFYKQYSCLPFLGLNGGESHRRFLSLSRNGCNYYNGAKSRSAPFAIFNKSDIIHLALDLGVKIPEIYGDIKCINGEYITTGCSRTGCDICGFGIQFEKTRPHRFDRLYIEEPKKWDFWINKMGYGDIFDKIGFQYKQPFKHGDKCWL